VTHKYILSAALALLLGTLASGTRANTVPLNTNGTSLLEDNQTNTLTVSTTTENVLCNVTLQANDSTVTTTTDTATLEINATTANGTQVAKTIGGMVTTAQPTQQSG
jgi:hypothetical protein